MKLTSLLVLPALALTPALVMAQIGGAISTDRFGYTGSVERYDTLADAQAGTNIKETISVGNRDLSLFIVKNLGSYWTDASIVMGSWWYTTDPSGSAGYGNTRGNTGVGFLQIYEDPFGYSPTTSLTRTSLSMGFGGFNGTNWTTFSINMSGVNANYASSYARFSPFTSNNDDAGTYLEYSLSLTATGLLGTQTGSLIEATNHPTGVTGTFSGLFFNPSSDPTRAGFYKFSMALDMENWAYENRDSLTGDPFADSYFAEAVPEPFTMALGAAGLAAAIARRRRSRKS